MPGFLKSCVRVSFHTHNYIEQQMNGETLIILANQGSLEQMEACDLKTVRQQINAP